MWKSTCLCVFGCVLLAGVTVLAVSTAAADTIYVDASNCPGPGDGSEADPYCSIQTAIENAVNTDEIVVAPDAYFETVNFLGKAINVRSSDGPGATTIDATGLDASVVQCISFEGPETVLQGFTITGGNADDGGGMNIMNSSPTVTDCVFSGNIAERGAGMRARDFSNPTITDCMFIGNEAISGASRGGGLHTRAGSSPVITNCQFIENTALSGGGIYCEEGRTLITDCWFIGNAAEGSGGGVTTRSDGPITAINCMFIANTAGFDGGGGMQVRGIGSVIDHCVFRHNFAEYEGGGLRVQSATITDCTFTDNQCGFRGGGMFLFNNIKVVVTDTHIEGNIAQIGGGIYDASIGATITDSTLLWNTASVGGGMYIENADATIESCDLRENEATLGAGMYLKVASPSISTCTFEENIALQAGGGIYNELGNPQISSCTFHSNESWDAFGGGGAIYNLLGSPNLTSCMFERNVASGPPSLGPGGGLCSLGGSPVIRNCSFANELGRYGGAIYTQMSDALIVGCTFMYNSTSAYGFGGAVYSSFSEPLFISCRIEHSHAYGRGGALFNEYSSPTLVNCTLVKNYTVDLGGVSIGGAMFNEGSTATLINCTLANNNSADDGGGIYNLASQLVITNSVLWNNAPDQVVDTPGSSSSITYSNILGGFPGVGNIDAEPMFIDTGGEGNYRLLAGSPCIDAGDNSAIGIITDLDGNSRFVDDPDTRDTGNGKPPLVDMGAYEFQIAACLADVSGDGVVGPADLAVILGNWGSIPPNDPLADIDNDGVVGPADLAIVLGNWGLCK